MERRGTTPAGGFDATDLRPLMESSGPFVTLLLETDRTTENAGIRWERRWATVRKDLLAAGATYAVVSHLADVIRDTHRDGDSFYAVANDDRVWVVSHWPGRPTPELVRVASLPS